MNAATSAAWLDAARSPYLTMLMFGFLPTIGWKLVSAFVAHGVDDQSEFFRFIRCVATALLAGIAAKFLLNPSGALSHAPVLARVAALAAGVAAFALTKRSVFAGVVAGEAAIMALTWGYGG